MGVANMNSLFLNHKMPKMGGPYMPRVKMGGPYMPRVKMGGPYMPRVKMGGPYMPRVKMGGPYMPRVKMGGPYMPRVFTTIILTFLANIFYPTHAINPSHIWLLTLAIYG